MEGVVGNSWLQGASWHHHQKLVTKAFTSRGALTPSASLQASLTLLQWHGLKDLDRDQPGISDARWT